MIFIMCFNDDKMSCMVCRSVLRIQMDDFRPPIIILTTSGHMANHILISKKSQNIVKNMIFDENSIFDIVVDINRNDDIWPEMDSLGVLEMFCTKNRYPNAFRSNFKSILNLIFCHFHMWAFPIAAS